MFYYTVESSHWPMDLEFRSTIPLKEGQCFRITSHDGERPYPTRFKVKSISESPRFNGKIVTINSVNLEVDPF